MKGPEPIASVICVIGVGIGHPLGHHERHVRARLAKRFQHQPVGLLSTILMVLASCAERSPTTPISFWPHRILGAQRLIEATQSSAVTGLAVVPLQAVAQVKVQVSLSGETAHLSTICGLDLELLVESKQGVVGPCSRDGWRFSAVVAPAMAQSTLKVALHSIFKIVDPV